MRTFVHEVTPAGLEQQLKDAMAEEIRTLARSMKHTQVRALPRARALSLGLTLNLGLGLGFSVVSNHQPAAARRRSAHTQRNCPRCSWPWGATGAC